MKTKTAGATALLLFSAAFLFHFSAKKQPTGEETGIFVDALYMLWPTFSPYEEKMSRLSNSLRGSDADWTYLLLAVLYSSLLTAAFFVLTGYVLKKKRYV